MTEFHYKNGQCENCGRNIEEVGLLQIINFWDNRGERLFPYYLYVCNSCFETQKSWCNNIFPDVCQKCNALIEDGEHYLDRKYNQKNEYIDTFGITKNEPCNVICFKCYNESP